MQLNQQTIQQEVSICGQGLHTGLETIVKFKPANEGHGISFIRTDLINKPKISAFVENVVTTNRGTTISENGAVIQTTEHVLAAIAGLEIDNLIIELNNEELPILDGSSAPFITLLETAGIQRQDSLKKYYKPNKKIHFKVEDTESEFILKPAEDFQIKVEIDYKTKILGVSNAKIDSITEFKDHISASRTFCFLHELKELHKNNLIKGGDLNNAIVLVEGKVSKKEAEELKKIFKTNKIELPIPGILNNLKLKFENEPARHKLLDVIGDLKLLGTPIKGHLTIKKPGHKANIEFAKKLLYIMKNNAPYYNPNEKPLKDINEIMEILPHRPPFLLIDKIIELSDQHVVGVKNVSMNEDFFRGHFPDSPVMPGVLQIEAMAQAGGILILNTVPDPENYLTYFMKIDKVKFKQKVLPGDTLIFKLELASPIRRGICHMLGKTFVGEKLVMEGELMAKIEKVKR